MQQHYAVTATAGTDMSGMLCALQDTATLPTVMATVDAAFRQAAAVEAGDRVLVHAATGGVGLAAVQILQVCSVDALRLQDDDHVELINKQLHATIKSGWQAACWMQAYSVCCQE